MAEHDASLEVGPHVLAVGPAMSEGVRHPAGEAHDVIPVMRASDEEARYTTHISRSLRIDRGRHPLHSGAQTGFETGGPGLAEQVTQPRTVRL